MTWPRPLHDIVTNCSSPLTVRDGYGHFPVHVDSGYGGELDEGGTVMLYGCLQVPVPILSALEGNTHGRLHDGADGTGGVGVILGGAWDNELANSCD